MILTEMKLMELKHLILKDFKSVIPDIEKDFELALQHFDENCICYVWKEEDEISGYMCIVRLPEAFLCSYTKNYKSTLNREQYKLLKKIYFEAESLGLQMITDGTNFKHCKNHVIPIVINGENFYQWHINK